MCKEVCKDCKVCNNNKRLTQYIRGRIEDLAEDRMVSEQDSDKAWIARLMQELDWAHQVSTGEYKEDCVLGRY